LVYLPPRNCGLEQGTSFHCAEKVGNGEDLRTAGALTAKSYLAAHQITVITAPGSQKALIACRALVHRLLDQSLRLTQVVGELCERRLVRLTATESERALAAGWAAIDAAVLDRDGPVAHLARPQLELGRVTVRVTHGDGHAPTACAKVGVSSRTR
jgi:hypothetical protein